MIQGFSSGLIGNRELIYETDLPSFQRDFAALKTLDHGTGPAITFTRASGATFFDANGVLQTATNDTPRFDHDPVNGASRGLLIEESRTNSFTHSAKYDEADWTKTRSTVSSGGETAPDGSAPFKFIENNETGSFDLTQNLSVTSGTALTLSIFLKAAERTFAVVKLHRTSGGNLFGATPQCIVNLSDGTISGIQNSTSVITNVGNGWYRVSVTGTPTSSGSQAPGIAMYDGSTSQYSGDGTSGLFVWGAQLEAGGFATSYIPTTGATATRAADSAVVTPVSLFYSQSEGTLFVETNLQHAAAIQSETSVATFIGATTTDNQIRINRQSAGTVRLRVRANASDSATPTTSASVSGVTKVAGAFIAGSQGIAANGSATVTATGATIPQVISQFVLGAITPTTAGTILNGHIRKLAYWPKRLTNTLLEQLTT
jgi:hypothetical protein